MKSGLTRLFLAFIAAAFAASVAYAAPVDGGVPQQEPPKDCKKNPNDPRCKDEDKK